MQNDNQGSEYVDRLREDTQRYVRGLLAENQEMRLATARLENETALLRETIDNAQRELLQHREHEQQLQEALNRVRAETEQYEAQYAEVEMRNTNLANLYVASYQLHGTLDRAAVLAAMQEIIVDLIGSERFGICELDQCGTPEVIASVGLDHGRHGLGADAVARTIATGEFYAADHDARHRPGDKTQLEPLDHELFDLLATHAATALYCTALRERLAAEVGAA